LVTPLVRPFIRALAPFGMIEASMPGSGKTILAGCVGLLVGQRVLTWTDSEDELCKSITTVLADSVGVVVFDNLAEGAVIDSAVLAPLVTERTWTNRRLGTNAVATFPNDRLWLATGNNLRTGGNMASRTVWIRLDPNFPRPEAGTGFTIPNLDSWILDPVNRATVLRYVLTLVLDWTVNGAPAAHSVPQMRQFTRWAQHVGGLLAHHNSSTTPAPPAPSTLSDVDLVVVTAREGFALPEPERASLARRAKHLRDLWVSVGAEVRPDLGEAEVHALVEASFPLINEVAQFGGSMDEAVALTLALFG
jgi:hypothetical protein